MSDPRSTFLEQLNRINISESEIKAYLKDQDYNQSTLERNLESVISKAESVLESPDAVKTWLLSPKKGLAYQKPLVCAFNDEGAQEVIGLLCRIEHGVFS